MLPPPLLLLLLLHQALGLAQVGYKMVPSWPLPYQLLFALGMAFERLVSRFKRGLVACMERPCFETRVAIIKSKAELVGIDLPDEVPAYIAARIDSNIRELEGALTRVRGHAAASGIPITLESAKAAMKLEAVDYLQKPFNNDEFREVIARVMRKKGLARTPG